MIGFFKNLFNGIVSFFTGIFSSKKSQENKPSTASPVEKLAEATSSSAQKLAEATSSSAQKLAEATSSSAQKLTEATSSSAQKLTEATSSSAQKLAEATGKSNSGIVSSVTGFLGGEKAQEKKPSQTTSKKGKRSGYFMELDEDEEMKTANNKQPAQAAAKTKEPVAAAKPAKAEATKTKEPVATAKPAKAEIDKSLEPVAQKSKVELVQTAEGIKAEPAKPAKAPGASANGQNQTETTFAPKYLIPSATNSRRRPGPNMNTFLDMARQVKTPGKA